LIEPAKPCIVRFRGHVSDPYFAQVTVTPTQGFIALSFESGQRADFNACVVDAVKAAHIPAGDLDRSLVVPFAFSFSDPAPK
jgi:hypothetical protein